MKDAALRPRMVWELPEAPVAPAPAFEGFAHVHPQVSVGQEPPAVQARLLPAPGLPAVLPSVVQPSAGQATDPDQPKLALAVPLSP